MPTSTRSCPLPRRLRVRQQERPARPREPRSRRARRRTRLAALASDALPELAGLLVGAPDPEVYDEGLLRAVRAFQQHKGLIVDGVVGVETFGAIDGARWSLGDRILVHTPGHLQRGEDVVALQERLNTLGFASGRVDGRFGPETERAVRSFQRAYGLPGDGSVGPETLRAFEDLRRSVSGGSPTSCASGSGSAAPATTSVGAPCARPRPRR